MAVPQLFYSRVFPFFILWFELHFSGGRGGTPPACDRRKAPAPPEALAASCSKHNHLTVALTGPPKKSRLLLPVDSIDGLTDPWICGRGLKETQPHLKHNSLYFKGWLYWCWAKISCIPPPSSWATQSRWVRSVKEKTFSKRKSKPINPLISLPFSQPPSAHPPEHGCFVSNSKCWGWSVAPGFSI